MTYTAHIRRNADGVIRQYTEDWDWHDGGDFLWEDGNYACDCNRSLFFHRAANEPEPDEISCGCTAFSVQVRAPDGSVLYQDDDWNTHDIRSATR